MVRPRKPVWLGGGDGAEGKIGWKKRGSKENGEYPFFKKTGSEKFSLSLFLKIMEVV